MLQFHLNVLCVKVSKRTMSKRKSLANTSGGNTLFNYFAKSPVASPRTPQQSRNTASVSNNSTTPKSSFSKDKPIDTKGHSNKKNDDHCDDDDDEASSSNNSKTPKSSFSKPIDTGRSNKKNDDQCDDDESPIRAVKPKRLKLIDTDSDSDRENESVNIPVDPVPPKKLSRSATSAPSITQAKKKMKMDPSATVAISFEDKLKQMEVQDIHDVEEKLEEIDDEPVLWAHNKMEFLKPEKITDINGNKPDHPDYDPKTLLVPKSFLDKLTPVRYLLNLTVILRIISLVFQTARQWWEFKYQNFDCVLFFKVGTFYELYHMDADIGVTELGFTYMKGDFAHSGFPEQSYDRMVTSLVAKGFKVHFLVNLIVLIG